MTKTEILIAPLENQLNQTDVLYIAEYVNDVEVSSTYTGFTTAYTLNQIVKKI
jgi:hypothetical protein